MPIAPRSRSTPSANISAAARCRAQCLLMLKLTAVRSEPANGRITPRAVLETLSQISGLPRVDPRHQGAARPQSGARFLHRARARPGRGGRGRRGPHRHAQGRPERSGQTDRRLSVRRPDRHRQDRACQSGIGISVRFGRAHDPARYERIPDPRLDEQDSRAELAGGSRGRLADQPRAQAAVLGAPARRVRKIAPR